MEPVFDRIKDEVLRWKSLDIAFSCISHTSKIIEYLGNLKETMHLNSLTIGPMGQGLLLIDDGTIGPTYRNTVFKFADPTKAKSLLQPINVQPAILFIDTYPAAFSPILFSPRLTVLEIFTGNHHTHCPDPVEWHQILSSTPQLVKLHLWSSRHWEVNPVDSTAFSPLHLADLHRLELTGAFIVLSPLLIKSPLPMLDRLLLDFVGTSIIIPQELAGFASVSPAITQLYLGSMPFRSGSVTSVWWTKAFESMPSLRSLTLFEVEWLEAAAALMQLTATPHKLSRIKLKGIWDIDPSMLARLQAPDSSLPPLEIIDCTNGQAAKCTNLDHVDTACSCDSGSSCKWPSQTLREVADQVWWRKIDSDSSPFASDEKFPPSVLDSEGSEISYGEDESPEMAEKE
ncbi:hypothetical protein FRC06_001803 [Ceratobasidium sp. 370]|nr:hypothetical protein FRC06_001803 [Ceratobasidium sp. 370]